MQKASLVLRTSDLPLAGTSNSKGIVNADRTRMTWKNINMRDLLGDMYDKHDLFNLKLNCVSLGTVDIDSSGNPVYTYGESQEDRIVTIEMEGLPFANNSYDFTQGANKVNAVLGVYEFDYDHPIINYNDNSVVTFSKGGNMCDLTITYKTVYANQLPSTLGGNIYPRMVFLFSIYGIERERKVERLIDMSM